MKTDLVSVSDFPGLLVVRDVFPTWQYRQVHVLSEDSAVHSVSPRAALRYSKGKYYVSAHGIPGAFHYFAVAGLRDTDSFDFGYFLNLGIAYDDAVQRYISLFGRYGLDDFSTYRRVYSVRMVDFVSEYFDGEVTETVISDDSKEFVTVVWFGFPFDAAAFPGYVPYVVRYGGSAYLGFGGVPYGDFVKGLKSVDGAVMDLYRSLYDFPVQGAVSQQDYVRFILRMRDFVLKGMGVKAND